MRRFVSRLAGLTALVVASVTWTPAAGAVDRSEQVEVLATIPHDWPNEGRFGPPGYHWARDMAVDRFDRVFVVDGRDNRLFEVTPQGDRTMLIGGNGAGSRSDQLDNPWGVAVDRRGNIFVSDTGNDRVQRIAPDRSVSTLATGVLSSPTGVAVDHLGNVFIAERYEHRVIRVAPDGTVTVVAGGNGLGGGPDQLGEPMSLALDHKGALYIADSRNHRIQRVELASGEVTTAARSSQGADPFYIPRRVAVDAVGNIYVDTDEGSGLLRVAVDESVTLLSATQSGGYGPTGGIAIGSDGSLYFADNWTTTEIRRLVNTTPPGPRQITGPFARTTGIEGSIARLYLAILGRQPDLTGYDYWVDQARNGATINEIAHHFLAAAGYNRTRSSLTNAAFVNQLYLDVMGRPADPDGATYWTNVLDSGVDRPTVLLLFSESAEFKRHTRTG